VESFRHNLHHPFSINPAFDILPQI
jgi:hypothetical protein